MRTKEGWHYIEFYDYGAEIMQAWRRWIKENVGVYDKDWGWDDCSGHNFICFRRKEDATAFLLTFPVKTTADTGSMMFYTYGITRFNIPSSI